MLEKATIARPYAQAVFELACEENSLDQWSAFIQRLAAIVTDPMMRSVISNPRVEHKTLVNLVTELCGDAVFDSARKFVRVLVDAGRLGVAREIYQIFENKRARHVGLTEVEVVTAFPLSEDQKNRIQDFMSGRMGTRIEISSKVNQDLIGGAVIRAGDSVIDASLRGRLRELSNEFAS